MQPKTELQKKVVALSAKLPPITTKQKAWAFENCLDKYVVILRKTMYCLECGHSWKDNPANRLLTSIEGCTCPVCGHELKIKTGYNRVFREAAYYAIITTRENMQVIRMFYVAKDMKKMQKANLWIDEVMQHWINESGKVITMSKTVNGLSMYYDQWVFHSDLEVRLKSYKSSLRYNIGPYKIYPGRRILPVIKRNGFKGHFYGLTPQEMFSLILSDNYAETLLKTGQIELLKKYDTNTRAIRCNWPSIRICIRNGYKITDATIWLDLIKLLYHFGKDIRSPKYICPDNLKMAHDRLTAKKIKQDRQLRIEELKNQIQKDQLIYEKDKGRFFGIRITDGQLLVKTIESVEEFLIEGDELNHCVFTNEYFKKPESLILSARVQDKPVETIEVSLDKFSVIQSRGLNNNPTKYHDRVINLVNSNMQLITEKVNAKIIES